MQSRTLPPMLTQAELERVVAAADYIRSYRGRPWHLVRLNWESAMKRKTINGRAVCADPRYPDLTEKQYRLLQYLTRERARAGAYPTYREIERHFGFRSPNSITQLLRALERKGYIKRTAVGVQVTRF